MERCTEPGCHAAVADRVNALCLGHYGRLAREARRFDRPGDLDDLRRSLGISPDTYVDRQVLDGGRVHPKWGTYRAEIATIAAAVIPWKMFPRSWGVTYPGATSQRVAIRWRVWSGRSMLTLFWTPKDGTAIELRGRLQDRGQLEQFIDTLKRDARVGRPSLVTDPGWRAMMREIEGYLAKPGTTRESAVRRFDLTSLVDVDQELEAEASGDDFEARLCRRALDKLKRHLRLWRSLPESVKRA